MGRYQINYDISTGVTRVKHFSRQMIGGARRAAARRTADALAEMDFRVAEQGEMIVRAERLSLKPQAKGKIFRTPTEVFVTLRELSENLTQADYEYFLTDAAMFRADHEIVEREIDALAALAERFGGTEVCRNCRAAFAEESLNQKFCPSCGAERAFKAPPELELLKIVAASKRGQRATLAGASVVFSSFVLFLALLVFAGLPLAGMPVLLFGAAQIVGWLALASGLRSTQKALSPASKEIAAAEQFVLAGKKSIAGNIKRCRAAVGNGRLNQKFINADQRFIIEKRTSETTSEVMKMATICKHLA